MAETVAVGDAVTWPLSRVHNHASGDTIEADELDDDYNRLLNAVNELRKLSNASYNQIKDAAGTARDVYGVDANDLFTLGNANLKGTKINAGTRTTAGALFDIAATWNGAGVTFSGIKANITDTASAAASLLLELEVGGADKFTVDKTGAVTTGSWSGTAIGVTKGGTGLTALTGKGYLLAGSAANTLAELAPGANDTALIADSAQATGLKWAAIVNSIAGTTNQVTASGATGAVTLSLPQSIHTGATPTFAGLTLAQGTITSDAQALGATVTWNNAAVAFTAVKLNVTDTASAAASLLADLQVGGASKWKVDKAGNVTAAGTLAGSNLALTGALTTGGAVTFSGAYTFTGTLTANTSVTFPTSGTLATTAGAFANPMTTLGDVIYGGTAGAATRVAGNITTAKQFFTQTGTGSVSAAPAWAAIVDGDLPSTMAGKTLTSPTINGTVATTGLTMPAFGMADAVLTRPEIKDYAESVSTNATSGAAATLNIENGNVFDVTLTANCTFTFSNPSATGKACSFTLILRQDATGSRTATWPAAVKWPAGTAPTLSTGASDVDIIVFTTVNAGTAWYGMVAGQDFS